MRILLVSATDSSWRIKILIHLSAMYLTKGLDSDNSVFFYLQTKKATNGRLFKRSLDGVSVTKSWSKAPSYHDQSFSIHLKTAFI